MSDRTRDDRDGRDGRDRGELAVESQPHTTIPSRAARSLHGGFARERVRVVWVLVAAGALFIASLHGTASAEEIQLAKVVSSEKPASSNVAVVMTDSAAVELTDADPAEPASLPGVSSAPPTTSRNNGDWGRQMASADSFDYAALPGRLSSNSVRRLWYEGLDLEREEKLLDSAQRYELIVGEVPEESYTYWRLARNYWRVGEGLPMDDTEGRVAYFTLAEEWAGRGISIDPECGPCMLWKFVSMGRQATTRGLWSAARDVSEMQDLLERGIKLAPDHRDEAGNSTLGNLYYSGAVFYRVIPDWWWLRLIIGVRGDLKRSLGYARKAVDLSEQRVDYRVELGAVLLCMGETKHKSDSLTEGLAVLEAVQGLPAYLSTDHLDLEHAGVLIENPAKACGYSRDGFIDMNAVLDEADVKRR